MVLDQHHRPLRNLRLSVTDRCNLRCQYCMPEADYVWLPREDLLQFEEIERLVDVFLGLGVDKLRLTGGEPLLRRDVTELVERLARRPAIRDLAMTTNGVLLAGHAADLRRPGSSASRSASTRCATTGSASWRASTSWTACAPASTPPPRTSPASRSTPSSSAAPTTTS